MMSFQLKSTDCIKLLTLLLLYLTLLIVVQCLNFKLEKIIYNVTLLMFHICLRKTTEEC